MGYDVYCDGCKKYLKSETFKDAYLRCNLTFKGLWPTDECGIPGSIHDNPGSLDFCTECSKIIMKTLKEIFSGKKE